LSLTEPKPSRALSSGSGLSFVKPKPAKAQPKPGPAHHYRRHGGFIHANTLYFEKKKKKKKRIM
jgi:hypothetical protein